MPTGYPGINRPCANTLKTLNRWATPLLTRYLVVGQQRNSGLTTS